MLVLFPHYSCSRSAIPVGVLSVLSNAIPDTSDNEGQYSPEERRHGCYTQWARLLRVSKLRWSNDISTLVLLAIPVHLSLHDDGSLSLNQVQKVGRSKRRPRRMY